MMNHTNDDLAALAEDQEFSQEIADSPRKLKHLVEVTGNILDLLINESKYQLTPTDIRFVASLLKYAVDTWYPDTCKE